MNYIEQGQFIKLLENNDCQIVAEIGVAQGKTVRKVFRESEKSKKNLKVYWAIDCWEPTGEITWPYDEATLEEMYWNVAKYCPYFSALRVVKLSSLDAAEVFGWADYKFDLVFIDAKHTEESIKADIEAWYPLVKKGGILCGHDYGNMLEKSVKKIVDYYFKEDLEIIPETWIWVHRKNSDKELLEWV